MYQLFITDFIKSKLAQLFMFIAFIIELLMCRTIRHSLFVFCLPYSISIILNYLMNHRTSKKPLARISAQFKPKTLTKIKITPK